VTDTCEDCMVTGHLGGSTGQCGRLRKDIKGDDQTQTGTHRDRTETGEKRD